MKKIKEFIVFTLLILVPIAGASAETKQGLFCTAFLMAALVLVAWDAGMIDLKPRKKDGK